MCTSVMFAEKASQSSSARYVVADKLRRFAESVDFHAELIYNNNNELCREPSTSSLEFILPLSVSSRFFKANGLIFIQVQMLNCSHQSIHTLGWDISNATVLEDRNAGAVLRTGQVQHLSFIVKDVVVPAKIVVKYSSALKFHEKKMHIDPVIDRKMKEQHFSIEHVLLVQETATYTISEPVVFGSDCSVTVSLLNGRTAKLRVEKSPVWKLKSPVLQEFVDRCVLSLAPCKVGNLDVPEIIVWVGEKSIKTEGPHKVFVLPFIKK
jgi:hypothetical protein